MPMQPLLDRFARAVQTNDGVALANLFTPDGIYDDGFFGPHGGPVGGRGEIVAMLQRFHDSGRDYWWEFFDPAMAGQVGYARWRFSYASRLPEAEGRPVLFEGMSCFTLRGGMIAHYREVFDRGLALAQLGFPPERIATVVARAAARQNAKAECAPHLARFGPAR